jgi:prolyl-tRNA editing enzyme YbaK/EbsC (Cys-tRNA(Pro) deacylase)
LPAKSVNGEPGKSVAVYSGVVWPEAVERIAAFVRASGAEGRLEELLAGAGPPAGRKLRADAFDGGAGTVVAVVPDDRVVDTRKLALAAGCLEMRPAPATAFPFQGARVFMDRSVVSLAAVWLEAGSPRHVLGLSPAQIARVTRAEIADLLRQS